MSLKFLCNKNIVIGVHEAGSASLILKILNQYSIGDKIFIFSSKYSNPFFLKNKKVLCNSINPSIFEIKTYLEKINPDYIITGSSVGYTIEKKLIILSKRMNIKCISFVDHIWNLWQRFSHHINQKKWYYSPDLIYLPHDLCKKKMIKYGCNPNILRVYNKSLLSIETKKTTKINIRKEKKRLNIDIKSKVVLFISEYSFNSSKKWRWDQSTTNEIRDLLFSLLTNVKNRNDNNDNFHLIIKLHPTKNLNFSNILSKFSKKNYTIINHINKNKLFSISDYIFGLNSIMLIESLSSKSQVFSYPGKWFKKNLHITDIYKKIYRINNLKEIKYLLNK